MPIVNQYILNLDLKRRYTGDVPKFRRGDSGELIFRLFDDGVELDLKNATQAKLYQRTPTEANLESDCEFVTIDNRKVIKYRYEDIAMVELGYNTLLLVVYEGDNVVSIQPFTVIIYDDLQGRAGTYLELIQEILQKIKNTSDQLTGLITVDQKGIPNGVATLDADKFLTEAQIPKSYLDILDHPKQIIYQNDVHGLLINADGILQHLTDSGYVNTVINTQPINGIPGIISASIEVVNGIATVTYTGNLTVLNQKWDAGDKTLSYFENNGKIFVGLTFEVGQLGAHTLWYQDSDEQFHIEPFEVTVEQLNSGDITVGVENGVVEVIVTKPVTLKKWAKGQQSISYFATNGTTFTGNSFPIDNIGWYTVYIKDSNNEESIYMFEVTKEMLKPATITVQVVEGNVTVSHNPNYAIMDRKWFSGNREASFFETNGTNYLDTKFKVDITGTYTVYHRYVNGLVSTKVFEVTQEMLPIPDTTPPTLTLTQEQINSGRVKITAVATDAESGVKSITLPNSTLFNGSSTTYEVTTNGTYTFIATDNQGNGTTKSIVVSTINTVPPTITLQQTPTGWTSGAVQVNVLTSANLGSVTLTKWSAGTRDIAYFATAGTVLGGVSFQATANGIYTVYAKDSSGNEAIKTINITNIDTTTPTLTLTQSGSGSAKTIAVSASDSESGIKEIVLPDGTVHTGSSINYNVYGNGDYQFTARNNAGLSTTRTTTVTGILVNPEVRYAHGGSTFKIATSGEVFAQGSNNRGQLGVGSASYDVPGNTPRKSIVYGIKDVVSASSRTFFLNTAGEIYFAGSAIYGYPLSDNDYATPVKIPSISGAVRMITDTYGDSLFYQVSNGDWYALGRNDYGQLGLGYNTTTNNGRITTPTKINTMSDEIVDITTQAQFTIFVLANGRVMYSGQVKLPLSTRNTMVTYPLEITGFPSNKPVKASLTQFGDNVLFILGGSSAQVMGIGYNRNYELGLGSKYEVPESPIYVNGFGGLSDIKGGSRFFMGLTLSGGVMTVGEAVGVSGVQDGSFRYAKTPTTVSFSGTAKEIHVGQSSVIIQTTQNRIYGAGQSYDNYFANSDSDILNTTARLTNLE